MPFYQCITLVGTLAQEQKEEIVRDNQRVEIRTVERIRRDAHADPGAHGAALSDSGRKPSTGSPISLFASSKAEITAQLITSKPGKTMRPMPRVGCGCASVLKRRIYDVCDKPLHA